MSRRPPRAAHRRTRAASSVADRRLRSLPAVTDAEAPAEPFPPIPDLSAAYMLALGLQDEFAHCHAGFLLGAGGVTDQGWVLTGNDHRPDDALMLCLLAEEQKLVGRGALLVSTGHPMTTDQPGAAEVSAFYRFGWVAGWRSVTFVDWIHTDGELFRSMRLVLNPDDPWPSLTPDAA